MEKLNPLLIKNFTQKLDARVRGTFLEKWFKYWKQIGHDYVEVGVGVKQGAKEKPLKATLYATGLIISGLCLKFNPDMQQFRTQYVRNVNRLCTVNKDLIRSSAIDHLKFIEKCFNSNLLRYTNFGLFSIVWVDKYSDECNNYESNCNYLKVSFWEFHRRIIDVGILGTWWVIERKMLDYDINY